LESITIQSVFRTSLECNGGSWCLSFVSTSRSHLLLSSSMCHKSLGTHFYFALYYRKTCILIHTSVYRIILNVLLQKRDNNRGLKGTNRYNIGYSSVTVGYCGSYRGLKECFICRNEVAIVVMVLYLDGCIFK